MKKILLVEDCPLTATDMAGLLESADYKVINIESSKNAIELLLTHTFDLIISNIESSKDAQSFLYLLDHHNFDIPVIFLSKNADCHEMRNVMNLGADDFLPIPFNEVDLLKSIEVRLKKHYNHLHINDNSCTVKTLSENDLKLIWKNSTLKHFARKAPVFHEFQNPRYLFQVKSGKIKTYETNTEGKEFITGIYTEGNYFGYNYLLDGKPYKENAEAIEPSDVYMILKEDFLRTINNNKAVAMHFIQLLSEDLYKNNAKLLSLAYNSVRKRVAEALVYVHDKFKSNSGEIHPELELSRENLANLAGTSHETAIRVLSDFKEEGLIELVGNSISVSKPDELVRMRN